MQPTGGFSHVTLTVTDLDASVAWYTRALGLESVNESTGPSWRRVIMQAPSGLRVGLTRHGSGSDDDQFSELRVGLDHVSIACADAPEVAAWAAHFDALDVAHGEVVDTGYATVLTARDPDGIPIEFFAAGR